jgi:hypothetical protein
LSFLVFIRILGGQQGKSCWRVVHVKSTERTMSANCPIWIAFSPTALVRQAWRPSLNRFDSTT